MNRIYHNPPHIYVDNSIYVVTSSTYGSIPYFNSDQKKLIVQEKIFDAILKTDSKLHAWVILDNHYHILFELQEGRFLGKLIKLLNGSSSRELNRMDKMTCRKVWFNYWDTCIRNEKDFYTRLNYIHHNPIKHGYLTDVCALAEYQFSSYLHYLKERGQEWLDDSLRRYPIKDFTEKGEP